MKMPIDLVLVRHGESEGNAAPHIRAPETDHLVQTRRHSLASFLVRTKTDPKTVQALLRHANVKTTLQLHARSVSEDRMAAQGLALEAFLQPPASGAVN
jgi:hypothetical protein